MKAALLVTASLLSAAVAMPASAATIVTIRSQQVDFSGNASFEGQRDASGVLQLSGLTSATGFAAFDFGQITFSLANLTRFSFTSASQFDFAFASGASNLSATAFPGRTTSLTATVINRDSGFTTGFSVNPQNISIDVREVAAAVPEPSTWALMLAGFALTGYALRRRRTQIAFV